ncbi:MAG: pitrilysin family protein [Gemmatimonadota bacterium]
MIRNVRGGAALCGALLAAAAALVATAPEAEAQDFQVPVEYYRLDNGLRVVLSHDATAPIATVAVYYNIGFRIEPRDRTGFAHLFEHMMFQGSDNLGKMEFVRLVQSNGGVLNGSTRFDFTNYFEIVPAHTLEVMLWAEADRMRGLAITDVELKNQQDVVKNEVRVNVLNQPYGGFPWLDMPQYANENWYNSHNFYGELEDLDAATVEDVTAFFSQYYAPNNAALVVVGDFDDAQARIWIEQYFGDIPGTPAAETPDISEPRQEEAKRFQKTDDKATRPALAMSWHVPERNTDDYLAMGLLAQILTEGRDSRLYRSLVQENGFTGGVNGGINLLGNQFNINGPTLLTVSLFHDEETAADDILAVVDEIVTDLQANPVSEEELERARVKMRSSILSSVEAAFGFGRADLLAAFALFDDDPARINGLLSAFDDITAETVLATAREYLRPTNRTVLEVVPDRPAT